MPGAFDYSKWDNLDCTDSDEEEQPAAGPSAAPGPAGSWPAGLAVPPATDERAAAADMQRLLAYGAAQGMDGELITESLGQFGLPPLPTPAAPGCILPPASAAPGPAGRPSCAGTAAALTRCLWHRRRPNRRA